MSSLLSLRCTRGLFRPTFFRARTAAADAADYPGSPRTPSEISPPRLRLYFGRPKPPRSIHTVHHNNNNITRLLNYYYYYFISCMTLRNIVSTPVPAARAPHRYFFVYPRGSVCLFFPKPSDDACVTAVFPRRYRHGAFGNGTYRTIPVLVIAVTRLMILTILFRLQNLLRIWMGAFKAGACFFCSECITDLRVRNVDDIFGLRTHRPRTLPLLVKSKNERKEDQRRRVNRATACKSAPKRRKGRLRSLSSPSKIV